MGIKFYKWSFNEVARCYSTCRPNFLLVYFFFFLIFSCKSFNALSVAPRG